MTLTRDFRNRGHWNGIGEKLYRLGRSDWALTDHRRIAPTHPPASCCPKTGGLAKLVEAFDARSISFVAVTQFTKLHTGLLALKRNRQKAATAVSWLFICGDGPDPRLLQRLRQHETPPPYHGSVSLHHRRVFASQDRRRSVRPTLPRDTREQSRLFQERRGDSRPTLVSS